MVEMMIFLQVSIQSVALIIVGVFFLLVHFYCIVFSVITAFKQTQTVCTNCFINLFSFYLQLYNLQTITNYICSMRSPFFDFFFLKQSPVVQMVVWSMYLLLSVDKFNVTPPISFVTNRSAVQKERVAKRVRDQVPVIQTTPAFANRLIKEMLVKVVNVQKVWSMVLKWNVLCQTPQRMPAMHKLGSVNVPQPMMVRRVSV